MKYQSELENIAKKMVQNGKGILAADESTGTIGKRLDQISVESTFDTRLKYREMLFTTSNLNKYISGVILYDETFKQVLSNGNAIPEFLNDLDILPGIKVDTGAKDFALHSNEKITEGLDGLRERLQEYRHSGAKFAKWRAVITIGDKIPSEACIHANAHALARYAALCQENCIVPIVEPEVLMNGSHSIDECFDITKNAQEVVFNELKLQNVLLSGIVLKPSMVISGDQCTEQANSNEVAKMTVECLKATVPSSVPGCAFLSGGQSDLDATNHLNLMNKNYRDLDWNLTFSYGRALQHPAIMAWKGKDENIEIAQSILYNRSKANGNASMGIYNPDEEMSLS